MLIKKCKICKKRFKTFLCRIKISKGKFCSKKCSNKALKSQMIGEKNPLWKVGKDKNICKICKKEFFDYNYRKRIYCSPECLWKDKQGKNGIAWKGGKPKCKICNKIIGYESTYCQHHKHLLWKKEHWEAARKGCIKMRGIMPKNTMKVGKYKNIKRGWFNIDGKKIFLRSKWEANYALYLNFLVKQNQILKWEYESEVFIFEKIQFGTRSFRPDFKIFNNNGSIEYHEIKGWMDKRSRTKLNRMRIYYPKIKLRIVGQKEYTILYKQLNSLLNFY